MALQFDCRNRNIARKALPLLLGVFIVAFLYKRNSLHHFNSLKVLAGTTQQAYSSQPGAKISETLSHHETEHRESIPPLRPVNVFQQYIQQHSQQVLLSEIQEAALTENRKYAVAYYWCPQRAGNILHSFFNTVVWSMIHNRTILWMYHNTSNQEQDCQAVLQRAQWLPSLLEWGPKLNLQDPVPVANSADTWYVDQKHQVVLYPQIPDVLSFDKTITRTAWSDHPLKTREFRAYIEQLPSDLQNISHNLYSEGQEFLFGMLYSELFQLQRPTASTIIGVGSGHNGIFSLALHSRHVVGADDGSFVAQEKECLDQLLKGHDDSCRIHIMSDRPRTIALLSDWLLVVKNCTVITATHDTGSGPVQEHGPWAGAGYLEDLDITAGARHGVIGDPHRSSTALLIDLMEYRRTVSAWKDDDKRIPQALKICKLPDKPISGYDYGPGSPTFRHHSYLEPLAPVRVLDKFMTGSRNESATILLSIDFDRPTVKEVYTVLNSKSVI